MKKRTLLTALSLTAGLLLPLGAQAETSPADLITPPPEATRHASGLVSLVLKAGTGERFPDSNDVVQAHYIGRDPEGKKFLSTYDKGAPGSFPIAKVFPGWSEGLQQMVVNEKRRLWIPAHLAPENPQMGPRGAVIFDVELLGILFMPNPPINLAQPDPEATRLPSGAFVKELDAGRGEEVMPPGGVALVHVVQWDEEGKTLDATYLRNRPMAIPLEQAMPAFGEAVVGMRLGSRRLVWVPRVVHQGQWPKAPEGIMVLEIQLERIMKNSDLPSS